MRLYNQNIHSEDTELVPVVKPPEPPDPFDWNTLFLLIAILCLMLCTVLMVVFFVVFSGG